MKFEVNWEKYTQQEFFTRKTVLWDGVRKRERKKENKGTALS